MTTPVAMGLLLLSLTVAGCSAERAGDSLSSSVSASSGMDASITPSARPSSAPPTEPSRKQLDYESTVASWADPLPPGYQWPAWSDLPHVDPHGTGQLGAADNAEGVYRCILVDAAWHAYFETNDSEAAREYALRADDYVIPDNPSTMTVTAAGVIVDDQLATASGICQGIVGDLTRDN